MKLPGPLRANWARTLPWLVLGVALTVLAVAADARVARNDHRWARLALIVEGEVGDGYTGSGRIPVAYTNPVTDQRIEVTVPVRGDRPDVATGDAIELEINPDDPERVYVVDDRLPYFNPANSLLWVGLALAWCAWRWWTVRRTARLASADRPAFAMLGAIGPASWFRRRPVLHLYPLDAAAGARPLCAVRLLSTGSCPIAGPAFAVEVKGVPRPLGRVVARAPGTGSVLWPVGHAGGHGRWPRPDSVADALPPPVLAEDAPSPPSRPAWWTPPFTALTVPLVVAVAGVALGILFTAVTLVHGVGYDSTPSGWVPAAGEVVKRYYATVHVRYPVDGEERTGTAKANYPEDYTLGRRYPVMYDPDDPSRVRISRGTYDLVDPLLWAWLPAVAAAVGLAVAVRRWNRAWALAREGPWTRLDVWSAPPVTSPLGDRHSGYVRAVIPRPMGKFLPEPEEPDRETGSVMVAGVPEPGEVVALADAHGTVVPIIRLLRVPSMAVAVSSVGDRAPRVPYVIRSGWGAMGILAPGAVVVVMVAVCIGVVVPPAGVVAGVIAAGAVVGLAARVRMVVDRNGITVCEGFDTRRLGWDEIDHIGAGHRRFRVDPPGRSGYSCLEIRTRDGAEPLRPLATLRTERETLQAPLAVIRRYAPHATRVRRWDDGGDWPD